MIAERARGWLAPGRCVAVLGSSAPWSGPLPWQASVVEVIDHWSALTGRPDADQLGSKNSVAVAPRHEQVLWEAGFAQVAQHGFPTPHAWTVDGLLGFLWSTSRTAGIRPDQVAVRGFEADLRERLAVFEDDGRLHETIAHYYILGRRP